MLGVAEEMRLYIAGPMTKHREENYNFPMFFKAQGLLEMLGHEVVNPARMDLIDGHVQYSPFEGRLVQAPGFTMAEAMRRDIKVIADCDAVVLLPGWEDSVGARKELRVSHEDFELPAYILRINSMGWPYLEVLE